MPSSTGYAANTTVQAAKIQQHDKRRGSDCALPRRFRSKQRTGQPKGWQDRDPFRETGHAPKVKPLMLLLGAASDPARSGWNRSIVRSRSVAIAAASATDSGKGQPDGTGISDLLPRHAKDAWNNPEAFDSCDGQGTANERSNL
jgi:hypothetical protein